MANYFVMNSKFQPYSFDELMKPYQMYAEEYDKQAALLDAAREREFSPDNLDREQDSIAYNMYNNAASGLKAASDELAMKGLSSGLKARIRNTARDYQTTMNNLNSAQQRLYAEQDRRAKLGPGYVYQQENLRIGDFLNGATPNQNSVKLSDVTADIAAEFQSRAKTISQDTWNKVLNQNGRVINGYYDVKTESGLKEAQLDTILQLSNPEGWNRFVASNPTITEEQKRELSGFINSIASEMDAVGYGNYNTDGQKDIWNAIVKGAHAGLGGEEHKYQIDRSYNPELAYRMQRDIVLDREKQEQKDRDNGKLPFYTDPSGNKWYSDGVLVWEHDRDGKEIMAPTPRTKVGTEAALTPEEKAAQKAAQEAAKEKEKLLADARKDFPMYFEAWNERGRKSISGSGVGEFDVTDREPFSFDKFNQKQQATIGDLLSKYGLTPDDIEIWKDFDWMSNNHYKIMLKGTNSAIAETDASGEVKQVAAPTDTLTTNRSSIGASSFYGFE